MRIPFIKKTLPAFAPFAAEFLGTFAFVFVSLSAAAANAKNEDITTVGAALASGLAYGAMVYATVHISGGNLNPAVTLALWVTKRITSVTALFYILMQILAGTAAAFLILVLFGREITVFNLGGPVVGAGVSAPTALIWEIVLTGILIFAYFSTMVDRRGPVSFGPLVAGLTVVSLTMVGFSISGAGLNPAKALGPALVLGNFDNLPVWILGPGGGALVGVLYDFLFLRKTRKSR